jgi:hypothetical protein
VLAGDEPHDVADLSFAVLAGEPFKRVGTDLLVSGELARVVERGALRIVE